MAVETAFYKCALGSLKISASDSYVTEISFVAANVICINESPTPASEVLRTCLHQFDKYFSGELLHFTFPVQQSGTLFQQKVWAELSAIPFGKTISYFDLSKKLGNTKAIRAAASANGKNSLAIVIPCHRVIGTNGSLVGYAGDLWRKKWLLDHEARFAHGLQTLF